MEKQPYAVATLLQKSEKWELETAMCLWTGLAFSPAEAKGLALEESLKQVPGFTLKDQLVSSIF